MAWGQAKQITSGAGFMLTTGKSYLFLYHCHANHDKQPSSLSTRHLLPSPWSPTASCPTCPAQSVAFPPPIYLFQVWPTPWYATSHTMSWNHPLTTTSTDQHRWWCSLVHPGQAWHTPTCHATLWIYPPLAGNSINRPVVCASQTPVSCHIRTLYTCHTLLITLSTDQHNRLNG